jgi:hypothetical protein
VVRPVVSLRLEEVALFLRVDLWGPQQYQNRSLGRAEGAMITPLTGPSGTGSGGRWVSSVTRSASLIPVVPGQPGG